MRIKACFGCQKRTVGCHATCQEYKDERAAMDACMREERKQKNADRDMLVFRNEGIKRSMRRRDLK